MTIGKLFHLLITLKLKKFLLISRLHCFQLRFIFHVENLVSRWAVSTDLVNHEPSFTLSCLWRIFLFFFLSRWSSWPPLVDQGIRYENLMLSSNLVFEHSILMHLHTHKTTILEFFVHSERCYVSEIPEKLLNDLFRETNYRDEYCHY